MFLTEIDEYCVSIKDKFMKQHITLALKQDKDHIITHVHVHVHVWCMTLPLLNVHHSFILILFIIPLLLLLLFFVNN